MNYSFSPKKWWVLAALILVLVMLLSVACPKPTPTATPRPSPTAVPTAVPTARPTPSAVPGPITQNITLNEFTIAPQDLVVAQNQAVTWNLTNAGRFPHNLFVHENTAINDKVGANLQGGQSKTVSLSFDKTGYFPIYCPVGPHEDRGMIGSLRVTGPAAGVPTIKVRHPAANSNLVGPDIVAAVEITGFEIDPSAVGGATNVAGKGHWHLLLDGKLLGPQVNIYAALKGLALGQHTVKAELHNNNHSPLSPPSEDSVTFNIVPPPTPTPTPTPTATPAPTAMNITLNEFTITPQEMTVGQNQTVTWNITNTGQFLHNLFVHENTAINDKVGVNLEAGQSKTVSVSFDKTGYFPIYCPVGPHENRGMVGSLQVTGPRSGAPSIKLRHPTPNASLQGDALVAVEITGFDLDPAAVGSATNVAGTGHWHLLLDGQLLGPQTKIYSTMRDLALGPHTVKVELHNNNHSPLSPVVEDTITFTVVPPPTPTPTPTPAPTATPTPAPRAMAITLNEFTITPQDLTVAEDEVVTLSIGNAGFFPHNMFVHDNAAVNTLIGANLGANGAKSVTVSFSDPGYFPIYCPVVDHENRGMVGMLRVTGPPSATPSIEIRHPLPNATLTGQAVVAVEIKGFELDPNAVGSATNVAGKGHWHLLLDGQLLGPQVNIYSTIATLTSGTHTLKAELHNNNHSALSPVVEDTVTFTVP